MLYFDDIFNTNEYSVKNSENGIVLELDLPGFKKPEVKLKLSNRLLNIEASSKSRGQYRRSFTIPSGIDAASVSSRLEDGVLCVNMRYKPEATERAIEIL
jgi:HSP20 family protein